VNTRLARPLMLAGIAAVVLGLSKIHAAFVGHYDFTGSSRFAWALSYIGVTWLVAYGLGLPDRETVAQARRYSVVASLTAPLFIAIVQLAVGTALIPRFVIGLSVPLFCLVLLGSSTVRRHGWHAAKQRDRVFAVLDERDIDTLKSDLAGPLRRAASLVGSLSIGEEPRNTDLVRHLQSTDATVLVLGRQALTDLDVVSDAASVHEGGMRVRTLRDFYEEWVGKVPLGELQRSMLLFDIGELHRPTYERTSRLIDLFVGSVGLVALAVSVPVVGIGNLFGNRGSLFFRQPRIGRGEHEFEILKFRSMAPGPSTGQWTQRDDQRVTRFGRILRLTHLDELPQVVNILKGDLSVVGPRPEQPRYVEELAAKIPFYRLRHLVRPGLTGWAQVNFSYGADERDALEKLQYEFWYLRHQSVALDLRIIARTLRSVLGFQGR
jgi:lipopolysaccharide/colanic/teichoic acid biosynthesis glycosyltransferase